MPMVFIIGGLAGQSLAPNPCFATLPISLIVLGSMLSATTISGLMQRYGRRVGFWVGTGFGAMGAATGAFAQADQRFAGLVTLVTTASSVSFFGIGAAFWGLLAGLAIYAMEQFVKRG